MITMVILFTVVGVILIVLAIPLMLRRVKPNEWYGLRVPATFADESVWYDANAMSGRDMLIVGTVQLALAVLTPLAAVSELTYVAINGFVSLAGAIVIAIVGWRRADEMLRSRTGSS